MDKGKAVMGMGRRWAVEFTDNSSSPSSRDIPDPLGFSRASQDQDDSALSREKKNAEANWKAQCIIGHQALPCLLNLLNGNHKKSIKKEACWTISNITAGNRDQIQSVVEADIIGPLVNLLQNAEFEIKKEAAWAISNATSGGSHEQIKYLVSQGCIKPLCDLLICPDPRIVTVCLEGLENILKVGEAEKNLGHTADVNHYAQLIDDAEGLEKIENLQSHDNQEIYEKAVKILETYWLEEDDETMPPGDAPQQGFQFGGGEVSVPSGGFSFN